MKVIKGYSCRITTEEGSEIIITAQTPTGLVNYLKTRRLVLNPTDDKVTKTVILGSRLFSILKKLYENHVRQWAFSKDLKAVADSRKKRPVVAVGEEGRSK